MNLAPELSPELIGHIDSLLERYVREVEQDRERGCRLIREWVLATERPNFLLRKQAG